MVINLYVSGLLVLAVVYPLASAHSEHKPKALHSLSCFDFHIISQLNLNLIIFRVEREAKQGGKMETLSKELDHRIRLSHLSEIVNMCL